MEDGQAGVGKLCDLCIYCAHHERLFSWPSCSSLSLFAMPVLCSMPFPRMNLLGWVFDLLEDTYGHLLCYSSAIHDIHCLCVAVSAVQLLWDWGQWTGHAWHGGVWEERKENRGSLHRLRHHDCRTISSSSHSFSYVSLSPSPHLTTHTYFQKHPLII